MSHRNTFLFADIPIEITHETSQLTKFCIEYLTDQPPRHVLTITKEDIQNEKARSEYPYSDGYFERLSAYRKVCETLIDDHIILFHSSAIMVDGKAYLFTAPSGTGKSTHARLWREMLGKKARMINDDKPLIHVGNGICTVYGTPYDGKEHLSTNTHAPVAGICILSQAKENRIHRVSARDALPTLLSQTYRPQNAALTAKLLPLVITLSSDVPIYRLECNISGEAAALSYQTMTGDTI